MNSFRKWFYSPRRDDPSLLAQFYYSDEELNIVARELDSFDGRKDPERCTALVNQLRQCQDRVLSICVDMMDELLPNEREPRDFRVKFPDDVMQENLAGQLWFGAECLAAGSSILNRETESTRMRPLAKAVTKTIENVRNLLREQCLKPIPEYTEKIRESLKILDRLFADFELSYVSAMVPVKTPEEYQRQQYVVVLFSETLHRAFKISLIDQEQIDNYDPALMFTIPRLAIVYGLLLFPDGPLCLDRDAKGLSELFRPFKTLLLKIRELLWTLSARELATLEKCLCSMDEPNISEDLSSGVPDLIPEDSQEQTLVGHTSKPLGFNAHFVNSFYTNYPSCRHATDLSSICLVSRKDSDGSERRERSKRERSSLKSGSRARARQERQNERFLYRLTGESQHRTRRRTKRSHSHTLRQSQVGWPAAQYIPHASSNYHSHYRQSGYNYYARNSGNYSSSRSGDWSHIPSRHDRINSTVICACGSAAPHSVEDHQRCSRRRKLPNHIVRGSSRLPPPPPREHLNQYVSDEDRYRESRYYKYEGTCNEGTPSEYADSGDALTSSASSANLQNSLRDVVLDDPALLSPSTFCEPDSLQDGSQTSGRDDMPPDISTLSISGNPYHEGSIPDWVDASELPEENYERALGNTTQSEFFRESSCNELPIPIERNISTSLRPYSQNEAIANSGSIDKSKNEEEFSSGTTSPEQQSFAISDDEEVALALQAAEVQYAWRARAKFSSTGDLIHRLFVCISGVADQLQTNYASDLRKILKSVFLMNQTVDDEDVDDDSEEGLHYHEDGNNDSEHLSVESAEDALIGFGSPEQGRSISPDEVEDLPEEEENETDARQGSGVMYSVTVPPSVFHDHSLMQYSSMSPPLFPSNTYMSAVANSDSINVPHSHESPPTEEESVVRTAESSTYDIPQSPTSPSSVDGLRDGSSRTPLVSEPPLWVPDHLAPRCMACGAGFTVIRRRHHCRNCGKVFCGQCSRHNVPLPHFGVWQNVRVCNACFLYYVTSSADGSAALGS